MDQQIESQIISAFLVDRKKERAKYELGNEKKRRFFIWDISVRNYYDEKYAQRILQSVSSHHTIYNLLKNNGAPDTCYVLCADKNFDGLTLPLDVALKHVVFNGPALISCIHGRLAYLEDEPTIGASNRYLLIRNPY